MPDRGDIVWLNHDPQAGHEQAGHRPALVMSPKAYNGATGLMLACPITSKRKGRPFEVEVMGVAQVAGVVLSHQLSTRDWVARNATLIVRAPAGLVDDVWAKLKVLLPK